MTNPGQNGSPPSDAGVPHPQRGARTEAEGDPNTSPAKQAVANQEKAFESGEENPT